MKPTTKPLAFRPSRWLPLALAMLLLPGLAAWGAEAIDASAPASAAAPADAITAAALDGVPLHTAPAGTERGARECTECHDETDAYPVLAILKTKHGVSADSRTPFANAGCAGCHGPSIEHSRRARRNKPDRVFGDAADASPAPEQNSLCLTCHESGLRLHWRGSQHEAQDVACTSCHTLHTDHDPVLANATQTDVCIGCHKEKRAELHRPSTHPLLDGQMACSDCHNPHGSNGPTLLVRSTLNETCYGCHAEKRGPFLWEHAPVREDCGNCHRPHGSTQPALMKERVPWLCQECHLAQQHPSTAYSGTGLPGTATPSGAQQLLGKSCMNCHSQVHGSNHPSGVRKTR
jgi:DmsE family decaheme c-type cytochrome